MSVGIFRFGYESFRFALTYPAVFVVPVGIVIIPFVSRATETERPKIAP